MVSVNMREMLEAGVHFGHQVRKWNPKMKPYIYGEKNGIYIINLQTSIEMFKTALNFLIETVSSGKEALIVGTKKQAQSIITEISEECGMHYVNKRWLGGLLTNFSIVKKSIEKLLDLDEMKRDGRWEVKSKKEQSKLEKIYKKLHKNLWGMRNIKELPGVLIVIDSNFEEIAVFEAKKLNIPIVAVVDTNSNPEDITYPVPGNDDAIRSIKLFTTKFGEAVKMGLEKRLTDLLTQEQIEGESAEAGEEKIAVAEGEIKEEEMEAEIEKTVEALKDDKPEAEKVEQAEVKEVAKEEIEKVEKTEVKGAVEEEIEKTEKPETEKAKEKEIEKVEEPETEKEVKQTEKKEEKVTAKEKIKTEKKEKEAGKEEKAEVKKEVKTEAKKKIKTEAKKEVKEETKKEDKPGVKKKEKKEQNEDKKKEEKKTEEIKTEKKEK